VTDQGPANECKNRSLPNHERSTIHVNRFSVEISQNYDFAIVAGVPPPNFYGSPPFLPDTIGAIRTESVASDRIQARDDVRQRCPLLGFRLSD
jgi:hypothetical protein